MTVDSKRLDDGFADRGVNVTRMETFVDAAFAFAVTLLVISFNAIPASIQELVEALKGIPSFAVSFALIAMFWNAHAAWSRRYGLDDSHSTGLSLLLVFLVLVYVYPLKVLFGVTFTWISQGWLPGIAKISSVGDLQILFVIYGVAFSTLSLCLAALYRHALNCAGTLMLEPMEIVVTRAEIVFWFSAAVIALLSILLALLLSWLPIWLSGLPGVIYSLMAITGARRRRAIRSIKVSENLA